MGDLLGDKFLLLKLEQVAKAFEAHTLELRFAGPIPSEF